jgi:V8-like Glu-specific endopeptidase
MDITTKLGGWMRHGGGTNSYVIQLFALVIGPRTKRLLAGLSVFVGIFAYPILLSTFSYADNSAIEAVFGKSTKDFLQKNSRDARSYILDKNRTGLFFTTELSPAVGRLLIEDTISGQAGSCSGIALNNSMFLTAAHCVCGIDRSSPTDAKQCAEILPRKALRIFLPRRGVFNSISQTIVHPDYRSPRLNSPEQYQRVADLSLIRINGSFGVETQEIAQGEGPVILASFGLSHLTIDTYAERLGLPVASALQTGLSQVAKYREALSAAQDCGVYNAADTFCVEYNGREYLSGPRQDVALCRGDSGAPLFQKTKADKLALIGIASFFSPPRPSDQCLGDVARFNHFVDILRYNDWIQAHIGAGTTETDPSDTSSCVDALFKDSTIDLYPFRGTVSITAVSSFDGSDEESRPSVLVSGTPDGYSCVREPRFGILHCRFDAPSFVTTTISSGIGQWTICRKGGMQ